MLHGVTVNEASYQSSCGAARQTTRPQDVNLPLLRVSGKAKTLFVLDLRVAQARPTQDRFSPLGSAVCRSRSTQFLGTHQLAILYSGTTKPGIGRGWLRGADSQI